MFDFSLFLHLKCVTTKFHSHVLVLPLSGLGMKCAAALFFLTWFPFMIPPSLLSPRYQARPEACCRYSMDE